MVRRVRISPAEAGLLLLALGVGGAGGALFAAVGLPAAWLSGSMVAVAVAAVAGLTATVPVRLRDGVFVLLGISMGSGITPDLVARAGDWPASLLGLAATVAATTAASYLWLRRVAGWDPATAYFAAIPGALTMTLATAAESRANLVRVSVSQAIRLLMLVAVLPLVVVSLEAPPATTAPGTVGGAGPLAVLLVGGLAGALVGHRLRLPAGVLIGAFAASGLLHGFGVVVGQLPNAIQVPAFVVLGTVLGLRFAGTGPRVVAETLFAGLGSFVAALLVAAAGAVAVAALLGLPAGQVVVAFAPGGLEAMVILAFLLKVDPAYVAAHHFARFVGMTVIVPFGARLVVGRDWASTTKDGEGRKTNGPGRPG